MLLRCCRACGLRPRRSAPARRGAKSVGTKSARRRGSGVPRSRGRPTQKKAKIGGTTGFIFLSDSIDHGWVGQEAILGILARQRQRRPVAQLAAGGLPSRGLPVRPSPCGGDDLNRSSRAPRTAKSGHGSWGGELGRRARYDAALRLAGPQRLVPRRRGAACTHLQPHCLPLALALAVALRHLPPHATLGRT